MGQPQGEAAAKPQSLEEFARQTAVSGGALAKSRNELQNRAFADLSAPSKDDDKEGEDRFAGDPNANARKVAAERLWKAKELKKSLDVAQYNYQKGFLRRNQIEKLGVDLAVSTSELKSQRQLQAKAVQRVNKRNCLEIGGVWIDEGYSAKTPTLSVKAQSEAYFRILELQPQMKDVFQLGNHVLWITPNGTALVIDTTEGKEKLSDKEINLLFAMK